MYCSASANISLCICLPNFVKKGLSANFVKVEPSATELWRHIHFLRWRPRHRNSTSGFVFVISVITAADNSVFIKFGMLMENHMPMAVKWRKSKPEVDGGRLFSETGSGNISAVDWDIWSKFGMLIASGLPTCGRWPNQKLEVDLWRYGRYLLKSIWRHNSSHHNSTSVTLAICERRDLLVYQISARHLNPQQR